jgi:hypothetical protein
LSPNRVIVIASEVKQSGLSSEPDCFVRAGSIRRSDSEIPALVIAADAEDCLIMSPVENFARRAIDLLHDIEG